MKNDEPLKHKPKKEKKSVEPPHTTKLYCPTCGIFSLCTIFLSLPPMALRYHLATWNWEVLSSNISLQGESAKIHTSKLPIKIYH